MGLVVLGVIVFLVSFMIGKAGPEARKLLPFANVARVLAAILVLIGALSTSVVQIDAGHVGVQKLFGKVQKSTLPSGLHIINPLMEVIEVDIRTMNYTMSSTLDEGHRSGDDAIRTLSADGLEVIIDLTVLYKVIPGEAPELIDKIGLDYEDKIVRPIARTEIRDNAVNYNAVALYSTKRQEFQDLIQESIEKKFSKRGLLVENLLIRNITLPQSVKQAIEQKINAEQEAQKMEFVLQKEKQEAERKRVEAQGIADYQRIIATNLTDKQLQYEQIKALKEFAASDNAKIVLMGSGKGGNVILDAK
ncbi:MAG: prohibitin family protein [Chitinophagaceae bacterium]|nr:prohibitin family protein [Chitinophagaceae bacterium]MCB9045360.1 prohibitin family protein [Chitinophagales bacterium]